MIESRPGLQRTPADITGVTAELGLDVELTCNNLNVQFGQSFALQARLTLAGQPAKIPGREVTFYWVHTAKVGYRNKSEEYTVIGKGITAGDGTVSLPRKSDFSSRAFAAALVVNDEDILASSPKLTLGQIVK